MNISIEDKAILSGLISLFDSFDVQNTPSLKQDHQAKIFITGFNDFFFNNILLKDPVDQAKLIQEIKEFHRKLNKPLMVWLTPETNALDLEEKLKANFECHGSYYGMLLEVRKAVLTPCPEHITIKPVTTDEEAAGYSDIFCTLFGLNNVRDLMKAWLIKQYQSSNPNAMNYIATINGEFAGVCTLTLDQKFMQFKTGGFYNTCVLPEYRKLGVGTAMASHRVMEARRLGLEYLSVILMSDAMARGYCEKLGFRNYGTFTPFFLSNTFNESG